MIRYAGPCLSVALLALSGCAIYSFETVLWAQYRTGGIGYVQGTAANTFIVEIWEHQHAATDLHNYETHTPELRAKAALVLLKDKEQCATIDVTHEEPFDYHGRPAWSQGRWWRMDIKCLRGDAQQGAPGR